MTCDVFQLRVGPHGDMAVSTVASPQEGHWMVSFECPVFFFGSLGPAEQRLNVNSESELNVSVNVDGLMECLHYISRECP